MSDQLTGHELSTKATQVYLDRAAESIAFVREAAGKEVIEWSAEEQAKVAEMLRPIYGEWLEQMAAQGIDGQALLDAAGVVMN